MADVITGLSSVSATIEQIVSMQIEEVLTAEAVVPPTISDYSGQVGPGMNTLKIPKFSNFTVGLKVSGTPASAQTNAFSTDDLPLDKHYVVQWLLEDIAELQSKIAVQDSYVNQAGKDLAARLDNDLIFSMDASPSAAAPDHIFAFDNSPTNTLSKADFLNARAALNSSKVPYADRTCLISPTRERDILAISEFVKVNEAGSEQALRNGQIGKLFGFDVIMSSQQLDDDSIFYHKSTQAYARQLAPRVQQMMDLENIAMRWSLDMVAGFKALDSGKRIVKINASGA